MRNKTIILISNRSIKRVNKNPIRCVARAANRVGADIGHIRKNWKTTRQSWYLYSKPNS